MSANKLICTTLAPITPGPISLNSLLMRGVNCGLTIFTRKLMMRRAAYHNRISCITPAAATPHDSAYPGDGNESAINNATIMPTLKRHGAIANGAKRSCAYNTPPSNDVKDISNR